MATGIVKEVVRSSLEAIAYQGGPSPLFRDLTLAFQKVISEGLDTPRKFNELKLGDLIRKHTGLNVELKLDRDTSLVNAYAIPILLDPNNPFVQWVHDCGHATAAEDWTTTERKILPMCADMRGTLDLTRSKVTGVFTKIPTEIHMGAGLWRHAGMTAAEVAAICLHEIGHVFTFFEMILHTATTNLTLMCAKRDINKMPSQEERVKLVYKVSESLQAKIENPERLADPKTTAGEFLAIFMAAVANDTGIASTTGKGRKFDLRSSEVAADQWANRHGSGRDLALGLGKMFIRYTDAGRPIFVHAVMDVLVLGGYLALAILGITTGAIFPTVILAVTTIGYLGFLDPEFRIYDDPKERVDRLRSDTIQNLKSNLFDDNTRKILLEDLRAIDKVIASLHDYRTIMNRLWIFLGSNRRTNYKQMRLEQELMAISNSNLWVNAAKFQQTLGLESIFDYDAVPRPQYTHAPNDLPTQALESVGGGMYAAYLPGLEDILSDEDLGEFHAQRIELEAINNQLVSTGLEDDGEKSDQPPRMGNSLWQKFLEMMRAFGRWLKKTLSSIINAVTGRAKTVEEAQTVAKDVAKHANIVKPALIAVDKAVEQAVELIDKSEKAQASNDAEKGGSKNKISVEAARAIRAVAEKATSFATIDLDGPGYTLYLMINGKSSGSILSVARAIHYIENADKVVGVLSQALKRRSDDQGRAADFNAFQAVFPGEKDSVGKWSVRMPYAELKKDMDEISAKNERHPVEVVLLAQYLQDKIFDTLKAAKNATETYSKVLDQAVDMAEWLEKQWEPNASQSQLDVMESERAYVRTIVALIRDVIQLIAALSSMLSHTGRRFVNYMRDLQKVAGALMAIPGISAVQLRQVREVFLNIEYFAERREELAKMLPQ